MTSSNPVSCALSSASMTANVTSGSGNNERKSRLFSKDKTGGFSLKQQKQGSGNAAGAASNASANAGTGTGASAGNRISTLGNPSDAHVIIIYNFFGKSCGLFTF